MEGQEEYIDLVMLLRKMVEAGGTDLHLCADGVAKMRCRGALVPVMEMKFSGEDCRNLILGVLTESQRSQLEETLELDLALQIEGLGRFRGNVHYCRGEIEGVFRHIVDHVMSLDELGHPPVIKELCHLKQGLVLVTGMTGSGKSTTLSAMIETINQQRSAVIVCLEDPIEQVYRNSLSVVKQREVGTDTQSFDQGLKHVLRQDPDVIVISEMRDKETIQAAITAAETGHLVLSTLNTIDAPKTVDRLVDVFPPDQQNQIVAQLSNCLEAVLSLKLLPKKDGSGVVMAGEFMRMSSGVRTCIRDKKPEQIIGLMEIGGKDGMYTIDDDLARLCKEGAISEEEALAHARDRQKVIELAGIGKKKKGLFG